MKLPILSCLTLSFLVSSVAALAEDEQAWELKRDRRDIQVYTRDVAESPFDAVRAVTELDGVSLSALVALIEDYEACPNWADRCAESYLLRRISATESLVYTNNDMPFPVRDRDAITRVVWNQDPQSLEVSMSSVAAPEELEEMDGRLRLREVAVKWFFTPLGDGRVRVVNEAHINPGSALPGWVTNMLLVDTPYETLRALTDAVRDPEYADAQVSFISEPEA